MKVGLLLTRIRKDEKAIIKALEDNNIDYELIYDKEIHFSLEKKPNFDILIERSIHHARALYTIEICEAHNIPTINNSKAAHNCGNKFLLTQELIKSNLPTPKSGLAFTKETAMQAIKQIGFPIVLKPAVGSWGRLLAKANDEDAAKAILDHKKMLGSYHHSVFYFEEFIKKDKEFKVLVMDNKIVTAVEVISDNWISNEGENQKIKVEPNQEIKDLAKKTAKAIKGDIVAVDILQKDNKYYVIDIDYTVEFHDYFKEDIELIMQKLVELIKSKSNYK